jgi:hypothetical protein
MLNREAANTCTKSIVFGLTCLGLEPTINHTSGEHADHYTTKAALIGCDIILHVKREI